MQIFGIILINATVNTTYWFECIFGILWCIPLLCHNCFKLASSSSRQLKSSKKPKVITSWIYLKVIIWFELTQKRIKRLFQTLYFVQLVEMSTDDSTDRRAQKKREQDNLGLKSNTPTHYLKKPGAGSGEMHQHNLRFTLRPLVQLQKFILKLWSFASLMAPLFTSSKFRGNEGDVTGLTWSVRGRRLIELGVCQVNLTCYLCKHGADKHVCVVTGLMFKCYAETSVFNL